MNGINYQVTPMTIELSRTSALASRHATLGSGLEDWNGMGTAWSYHTDPNEEHDAVREKVGMFDMSPLKKVLISGADSTAVLDHLTTRDVRRIAPGQAAYLSVLTEQGTMADDAILYNKGADQWMIVHGSGDTMKLLHASAEGKSVAIEFTDNLHDISVQGPQALTILQANCDEKLSDLAYFEHKNVRLFGTDCLISRTGYTGERGYEIFTDISDVCHIWDKLIATGVMPCSFAALDKVRIEAGLLFYGYDMTPDHTPYEIGLGFTVTEGKANYRGYRALNEKKGKETITNVCLDIQHDDMVAGGETLISNGTVIGVINSPCYSHRLGKSLALAHVTPQSAAIGTRLIVKSEAIETTATVVKMPIYDPEKILTHAA